MRVLYFTGAYRQDSMISHTHGELVAALRALSVHAEIATVGPPEQGEAVCADDDAYGTRVWRLRVRRAGAERIARAYSNRVWSFPPFATLVRSLRDFLTPERLRAYDVLHVGMAFPYATAVRHALGGRREPPALVTITGGDILTNPETGYGFGRTRVTRTAIQRTLRWAALVQANSPRSAEAVIAYGCSAARVAVQPPQSPHRPVRPAEVAAVRVSARARLEAANQIPQGRLLVGLGRMVPIKGYDDVIRAMPAILAWHPETTAVFAGPARDAAARTYVAELGALAESLGVQAHVQVRGPIPYEQVPDYFGAADAALIPSLLDGLNKTGIEAAAVGTPSIVSAAAGLADYVRQHGAGIVVPPRDPAALAAAANTLLGNRASWEAASAGAQSMAAAFSLERTAEGVARLYERVLRA